MKKRKIKLLINFAWFDIHNFRKKSLTSKGLPVFEIFPEDTGVPMVLKGNQKLKKQNLLQMILFVTSYLNFKS